MNNLTGLVKNAFGGKENLYTYKDKISHLAEEYQQLKTFYLAGIDQ